MGEGTVNLTQIMPLKGERGGESTPPDSNVPIQKNGVVNKNLDQLCQRFDGPVHIQQDQAQLGVLMS